MVNNLHEVLKDKNLNDIARRMTCAGYPITQAAIHGWMTGIRHPRANRLQLAERVVRETDPEIADLLVEIISTIGGDVVYSNSYIKLEESRQCLNNTHIEYSTENENVK